MVDSENRKSFYRVLFYVTAGISLLFNVWLITVLVRANYENDALREKLALRQAELAEKHQEEVRKFQYIDHFVRDEEFRNRVARDRLGYLGPDEFIFRFQDEGNR